MRVWRGQGYPNKHHEHFKVIFSITREEIELPVKIGDKNLNLTQPKLVMVMLLLIMVIIISTMIAPFMPLLSSASSSSVVARPETFQVVYFIVGAHK